MKLVSRSLIRSLVAAVLVFSGFMGSSASAQVKCSAVWTDDSSSALTTFKSFWASTRKIQESIMTVPRDRWLPPKEIHLSIARQAYEKKFGPATKTALKRLYNGPFRYALLGAPPRLLSESTRIARDLWFNPKREITSHEIQVLKEAGILDRTLAQVEFGKDHQHWRITRKITDRIRSFLLAVTFLYVLNETYDSAQNSWDFRAFSEMTSSDPELALVQILVETVPFPHLALRIDDQVYSFGINQLHSMSVAQYLQNPISSTAPSSTIEKLSLGSRAVRMLELRVTREQANHLRRELELQKGVQYKNITLINDCATMIFRALRRHTSISIPPMADSAPSFVLLLLNLRDHLGKDEVIRQGLIVDPNSNMPAVLIRNAWISMVEARLLLKGVLAMTTSRLVFDKVNSEDSLTWWDEDSAAEIESWKQSAKTEIESQLAAARASSTTEGDKRAELLAEYKKRKIQKILDNPSSEFIDLIRGEAQMEALEQSLSDLRPSSPSPSQEIANPTDPVRRFQPSKHPGL